MGRPAALVTGGAGFIGSNLVRGLLADGYAVRIVDDLSNGHRENLVEVANWVELFEGSILDEDLLRRATADVSLVFHEAAIGSVARSVEDPVRTHHANVTGTLAVLSAARDAGVQRVVYASSSSVYGGIEALPVREDLPTVPISPYGVSKLAGELYCRAFTRTYGFPTVCLRYFNVFGPRQDPDSEYAAVVPRFAAALLAGRKPLVFGDGQQSRDFTFVDNVVAANLLAARAGEEAFGKAFNVAQGGQRSLLDLLAALREATGSSDVGVEWADARPGDIKHSQADISAARRVLGYESAVSFEEGLRRTVEWLSSAPTIAGR